MARVHEDRSGADRADLADEGKTIWRHGTKPSPACGIVVTGTELVAEGGLGNQGPLGDGLRSTTRQEGRTEVLLCHAEHLLHSPRADTLGTIAPAVEVTEGCDPHELFLLVGLVLQRGEKDHAVRITQASLDDVVAAAGAAAAAAAAPCVSRPPCSCGLAYRRAGLGELLLGRAWRGDGRFRPLRPKRWPLPRPSCRTPSAELLLGDCCRRRRWT
mmetsp:Transcript_296/g.415  ORF Transcript_296/g.415 Transcript_296/m.415 type:complete len:215 (+) Transcript_296:469-1113(+)